MPAMPGELRSAREGPLGSPVCPPAAATGVTLTRRIGEVTVASTPVQASRALP